MTPGCCAKSDLPATNLDLLATAEGRFFASDVGRTGKLSATRGGDPQRAAPQASEARARRGRAGKARRAGKSLGRLFLALFPALVLVAAGIFLQLFVSSTHERPTNVEDGVALVVRGVEPKVGRSLRADMWIGVQTTRFGCDKTAHVKIVFSGTPAFWKDQQRNLMGKRRFAVMIFTYARVSHVNTFVSDASAPVVPGEALRGNSRAIMASSPQVKRVAPGAESYGTLVRGTIRDWGRSWVPIVAEFDADWVSQRSFGSCYIRLPSLIGTAPGQRAGALTNALMGLYSARDVRKELTRIRQQPFGLPLRPDDALRVALREKVDPIESRTVPASYARIDLVSTGDVDSGDSAPTPQVAGAREAMWSCVPSGADKEIQPGEGVASPSGAGVAFPPVEVHSGDLGCEGFAVVNVPSAGRYRDLALVVIGILLAWATDSLRKGLGGLWKRLRGQEDQDASESQ
jgi:hypothetical protein